MSITGEYFRNTLLPGAKAVDVCQALCQWHMACGYQQVSGRRLFNYRDFHRGEKRAFVLSNEKWCVVLYSSDAENGSDLRSAFAQFPAVIQLWAHDTAWGYCLEERGSRITAYCSKAMDELPNEPLARQPSDLRRLVDACDVPQARNRLRRLEKGRFLFVQKACAEFSGALEVPLAISTFYDADQVNAGLAEIRQSCGWTCQMLAFIKAPVTPADPVPKLRPETLTAERQAEIILQHANRRKRIRPGRFLLALADGLPLVVLIPGKIILALVLRGISMIPGPRTLLLGSATRFCDEFWKELQPAEPKRIQIQGELATNTRHSCSITAPPPVKVLPKFTARKPIPGHEPVFDIEMDSLFVSCMAHPSSQMARCVGDGLLEERSFPIDAGNVNFAKQRFRSGHYLYSWNVHAPKADYRFTTWTKEEMTSIQLEKLENIVRSLKIEQVAPRHNS